MTTENVTQFVKELRSMADWFETNGEDLPSFIFDLNVRLESWVSEKADMITAAKVLPRGSNPGNPMTKNQTDFSYELTRKFGEFVQYRVWTSRDNVCERVQIGTKEEPVKTYVETGETKEVPVYEWNCTDSLLK